VWEVQQSGSYTPTERPPRSHCTGVGEKQIIASDRNRTSVVQPYHSHYNDRKLCPRQHGKRLQHGRISVQAKDTGNVICHYIIWKTEYRFTSFRTNDATQPTIHRSGTVAAGSHKRHSLHKTRTSHTLRKIAGNCCIDPIMWLRNNRCQDTHKCQVLWVCMRARGLLRNPASPMSPESSSSFILIATKHASTQEGSWVSARSEVYSDVVNNKQVLMTYVIWS